ncbi:MAG: T9SS type A sorting domain-containing protein [Ignavibacteria bacterium]|nr:T9SS type A sorting domain-containing protein [Ignavibacteria bacterium]
MLVYNNQVTDFNITLTLQASKDLFFVNNVFNGAENTNYVVACWGAMTGPATFINNTIIGSTSNAALYLSPNAPYATDPAGDSLTYRIINNILEGGGWSSTNSYQYLRYNNLYTGLAWFQEYPDWSPAEGEIVDWTGTDFQAIPHEEVFENPQEFDYHLIPGSRAINSGIDPASFFPSEMFPGFDLNTDIKCNKRPVGSGWDIGAYEYDGATGVAVEKSVPDQFSLSQNYPNPFNPSTMINYSLPAGRQELPMNNMVTLKIYDVLGREITTLVNEQKPAGTYSVQWDGTNSFGQSIGSGVYFYQLKASEGFVETKKMLLIK